jgi:hypothetical protein
MYAPVAAARAGPASADDADLPRHEFVVTDVEQLVGGELQK